MDQFMCGVILGVVFCWYYFIGSAFLYLLNKSTKVKRWEKYLLFMFWPIVIWVFVASMRIVDDVFSDIKKEGL